jgi:alkylation response protein AidB-like acyl-CoA dehydrogenase
MILTEEQELIRATARGFARANLAPYAADWERDAIFPHQALKAMGQLGFMGMTVPPEWGGAGADYVAYALALEEIAAGDGATSTIMSGHNSVGCMPILEYGTPAQKERFLRPMARGEKLCAFCLTEPQGGSDAAAIKTRAERQGDHYVLNGTKQFITSGKNADVALVFAVTDPHAGKRGISGFLVETATPGYRVGRIEKKMGQNASDTCEIHFDNLAIPAENMLGEAGQGYRIALSNLEGGRIGIAAQSVGMARSAYEIALAYARERKVFNQPVADYQLTQVKLGRMIATLQASRQFSYAVARQVDAGGGKMEASLVKLFACRAAEWVTREALQIHGGMGYAEEMPVSRYFVDARVLSIFEGAEETLALKVIARDLIAGAASCPFHTKGFRTVDSTRLKGEIS